MICDKCSIPKCEKCGDDIFNKDSSDTPLHVDDNRKCCEHSFLTTTACTCSCHFGGGTVDLGHKIPIGLNRGNLGITG